MLVDLNGIRITAHLANSGRLKEVLVEGKEVFLLARNRKERKTAYDMVLVSDCGTLISVDARLPGDLVAEALRESKLLPFKHFNSFRREVTYGKSRLDFQVCNNGAECLIEVKSVTKVFDGTAMFPDAVTSRGARHLEALMDAANKGMEAAVIFVVQRNDAGGFTPDDNSDPNFGKVFREAMAEGVKAFAYKCLVTREEVEIENEIPVRF